MSHPYYHAVSSARLFGGRAIDYQPIHDWFDATKSHMAHVKHRAMRHHREGVEEAVLVFGTTVKNADGIMVPVREIGEQHCREDFGGEYLTFADWMEDTDVSEFRFLHRAVFDPLKPDELASKCASRFGGSPLLYAEIVRWMMAGAQSDARYGLLHLHSGGIFEMEAKLGTLIDTRCEVPTGVEKGACHKPDYIPTRLIGEYVVSHLVPGRYIPTPIDWLRPLRLPKKIKQPIRLAA